MKLIKRVKEAQKWREGERGRQRETGGMTRWKVSGVVVILGFCQIALTYPIFVVVSEGKLGFKSALSSAVRKLEATREVCCSYYAVTHAVVYTTTLSVIDFWLGG